MTQATAIRPLRALTAIRGLAAWWVVVFHFREALPHGAPRALLGLADQGYLAVDLFFELSGFVIALNYAARFRRFSRDEVGRFLGFRLARIYPLHLFMLLLFLLNPLAITLFSAQAETGQRYNIPYYLLSLALLQNWGFTQKLAWNDPAWSISTEWFAYLLFPLLAMTSGRMARGVASSLALIGLLLLALAAENWLAGSTLGGDIPRFGLGRCVTEFAIGIGMFRLRAGLPAPSRALSAAATVLAALCFAAFAMLPVADYAVMPLGFALLIFALTDETSGLSRLFAVPALEWIGLISYSTYLSHYFIKDWVNFLLVRPGLPQGAPMLAYLTLTALASVLLYYCVEVPGRSGLRRLIAGRTVLRASPITPA